MRAADSSRESPAHIAELQKDCLHDKAIKRSVYWLCTTCGLPVKLDREHDQWVPVKP